MNNYFQFEPAPEKVFGHCRCCLEVGYHRDITRSYMENGKRVNYSDILLDCFNLFISTSINVSSLICLSCVSFLLKAKEFKEMAIRAEKRLTETLLVQNNKEMMLVNVPAVASNTTARALGMNNDSRNFHLIIPPLVPNPNVKEVEAGNATAVTSKNTMANDSSDTGLNNFGAECERTPLSEPHVKEEVEEIEVKLEEEFEEEEVEEDNVPAVTANTKVGVEAMNNDPSGIRQNRQLIISLLLEPDVKEEVERDDVPAITSNTTIGVKGKNNDASDTRQNAVSVISPLSYQDVKEEVDEENSITVSATTITKPIKDNTIKPKLHHKKVVVKEKTAHIINALTLLQYSNITPFRGSNLLSCFYCRDLFDNLDQFKEHTTIHKQTEIKKALRRYGVKYFVVYADITNLCCTICNTNIPNFNELKTHLSKDHKKRMHLEYGDRVIPFKLTPDYVYECQMCGFNFDTFVSVERHMNSHFGNYVCKECGTGFVTQQRLNMHVKNKHIEGSYTCEICKKVFTTLPKRNNHVATVHNMAKRFKCTKCSERFTEYIKRHRHMVQQHGVTPSLYNCTLCDKCFDRRHNLSNHMRRYHLEERNYQCNLCSYKGFNNNALKLHMVRHDGDKIFECDVCKKSFVRKKTLEEHMRTHNNDRRFACGVCGQTFIQKCSLQGHLKKYHPDCNSQ
ncbi:unnamed protein product [Chilo suppressalis]|uniref:C2H2-type domain-containing protein n=1 Tax=Chilo suppressalis TaxID=168631 RepID=A0ABN8B3V8_CHISP|nr:unnamed protein product [Chilo suppressalis]